MADGRYIENRLLAISLRFIAQLTKFCAKKQNHVQTRHAIKIPNFKNSRWRTTAILKIVLYLYLYLSRESSDLDEIWCADSNFGSKNGHVLIYKKKL